MVDSSRSLRGEPARTSFEHAQRTLQLFHERDKPGVRLQLTEQQQTTLARILQEPNGESRARVYLAMAASGLGLVHRDDTPASRERVARILDAAAHVWGGQNLQPQAIRGADGHARIRGLVEHIHAIAAQRGAFDDGAVSQLRASVLVNPNDTFEMSRPLPALRAGAPTLQGGMDMPQEQRAARARGEAAASPARTPAPHSDAGIVPAGGPRPRSATLDRVPGTDEPWSPEAVAARLDEVGDREKLDLLHFLGVSDRVSVAEAYARKHGQQLRGEEALRFLSARLKKDLSEREGKLLDAQLDPANRDGLVAPHHVVHLDVTGFWSDNGAALQRTLMYRTPEELRDIEAQLQRDYGLDLEKAIDELSDGPDRRRAHFIHEVPARDEHGEVPIAEVRAFELREAMKNFRFIDRARDPIAAFNNTDFVKIFRMLESMSPAEVRSVAAAYHRQRVAEAQRDGKGAVAGGDGREGPLTESLLGKELSAEVEKIVRIGGDELHTKRVELALRGLRFEPAEHSAEVREGKALEHARLVAEYVATCVRIGRDGQIVDDDMIGVLRLVEKNPADGAPLPTRGLPLARDVSAAYAQAYGPGDATKIRVHIQRGLQDKTLEQVSNVVMDGQGFDSPMSRAIQLERALSGSALGLIGPRPQAVYELLDLADVPAAERAEFQAQLHAHYRQRTGEDLTARLAKELERTIKLPDGKVIPSRAMVLAEHGTLTHAERIVYALHEPGLFNVFGKTEPEVVAATLQGLSPLERVIARSEYERLTGRDLRRDVAAVKSHDVEIASLFTEVFPHELDRFTLQYLAFLDARPQDPKLASEVDAFIGQFFGDREEFIARNFGDAEPNVPGMQRSGMQALINHVGKLSTPDRSGIEVFAQQVKADPAELTAQVRDLVAKVRGNGVQRMLTDVLGNEGLTLENEMRNVLAHTQRANEEMAQKGYVTEQTQRELHLSVAQYVGRSMDLAGKQEGRKQIIASVATAALIATTIAVQPSSGPLVLSAIGATTRTATYAAFGERDMTALLIEAFRGGTDGLLGYTSAVQMGATQVIKSAVGMSYFTEVALAAGVGAQTGYMMGVREHVIANAGRSTSVGLLATDALKAGFEPALYGALISGGSTALFRLVSDAWQRRHPGQGNDGTITDPTDPVTPVDPPVDPVDPPIDTTPTNPTNPDTGGIGRPDNGLPTRPGGGVNPIHNDTIGRPGTLPTRPGGGVRPGQGGAIGQPGGALPVRPGGGQRPGITTGGATQPLDPGIGGGGTVGGSTSIGGVAPTGSRPATGTSSSSLGTSAAPAGRGGDPVAVTAPGTTTSSSRPVLTPGGARGAGTGLPTRGGLVQSGPLSVRPGNLGSGSPSQLIEQALREGASGAGAGSPISTTLTGGDRTLGATAAAARTAATPPRPALTTPPSTLPPPVLRGASPSGASASVSPAATAEASAAALSSSAVTSVASVSDPLGTLMMVQDFTKEAVVAVLGAGATSFVADRTLGVQDDAKRLLAGMTPEQRHGQLDFAHAIFAGSAMAYIGQTGRVPQSGEFWQILDHAREHYGLEAPPADASRDHKARILLQQIRQRASAAVIGADRPASDVATAERAEPQVATVPAREAAPARASAQPHASTAAPSPDDASAEVAVAPARSERAEPRRPGRHDEAARPDAVRTEQRPEPNRAREHGVREFWARVGRHERLQGVERAWIEANLQSSLELILGKEPGSLPKPPAAGQWDEWLAQAPGSANLKATVAVIQDGLIPFGLPADKAAGAVVDQASFAAFDRARALFAPGADGQPIERSRLLAALPQAHGFLRAATLGDAAKLGRLGQMSDDELKDLVSAYQMRLEAQRGLDGKPFLALRNDKWPGRIDAAALAAHQAYQTFLAGAPEREQEAGRIIGEVTTGLESFVQAHRDHGAHDPAVKEQSKNLLRWLGRLSEVASDEIGAYAADSRAQARADFDEAVAKIADVLAQPGAKPAETVERVTAFLVAAQGEAPDAVAAALVGVDGKLPGKSKPVLQRLTPVAQRELAIKLSAAADRGAVQLDAVPWRVLDALDSLGEERAGQRIGPTGSVAYKQAASALREATVRRKAVDRVVKEDLFFITRMKPQAAAAALAPIEGLSARDREQALAGVAGAMAAIPGDTLRRCADILQPLADRDAALASALVVALDAKLPWYERDDLALALSKPRDGRANQAGYDAVIDELDKSARDVLIRALRGRNGPAAYLAKDEQALATYLESKR